MNPLKMIGNQTTNRELFSEYKETYLILQRALLRANMSEEMKIVGENYEQSKRTLQQKDE